MHQHLHQIVICLDQDFEPFGQRSRQDEWGPDCSCSCKHFQKLKISGDWGICSNKKSPRVSLLTFEHQGCKHFESEEDESRRND